MIDQEVYRYAKSLAKFNCERDGRDTLNWLKFMWTWNKDQKAKRVAEKVARKIAAWEKKKAQDIKDEQGRQAALKILEKMARNR